MIGMDILQPLVVLMIWTMIVWVWMYATRIPAMQAHKDIDTANLVGGTGKDLDSLLPARVQWKAHNYNHLHEQPTIFYALVFFAALTGGGDSIFMYLAWAYVGLRVVHSLVQILSSKVTQRFLVFALSSIILMVMAGKEVIRVLTSSAIGALE